MRLIELTDVSREYGGVHALDGITLTVTEGEWLVVMGPSGSGKTTLLNLLAGLDRPTSGRAVVAGTDLGRLSTRQLARYRRENVGLVFQEFHLMPYLTALENVMLAQYVHSITDRDEAQRALEQVGLGHRLEHLPSRLSGGEKQRLCVARALINHPRLLLADEPTGNLDAANEEQVLELLADLHHRGYTLVVVTHNPAVAARADRVIHLEHGRRAAENLPLTGEEEQLAALWQQLEEAPPNDNGGLRPWLAEHALAEGLVEATGHGFTFTAAGRAAAAAVVRRQRLAEVLVVQTLEEVELTRCCRLQPVAAASAEQVCTFLGHPDRCPHDRPIPGADCCRRTLAEAGGVHP